MDPIGFGLEAYDREGKLRSTEPGLPQCAISGAGTLPELGAFKGADGLARALIDSGRLQACVTSEVFRFAMGRNEGNEEAAARQPAIEKLRAARGTFKELLLDVVSARSFGVRWDAGD
jgi:hypothetical protein